MHVYQESSACTIFYFWPTLPGRTGICKSGNVGLTARVKRRGPVEERPAAWHNHIYTNDTSHGLKRVFYNWVSDLDILESSEIEGRLFRKLLYT